MDNLFVFRWRTDENINGDSVTAYEKFTLFGKRKIVLIKISCSWDTEVRVHRHLFYKLCLSDTSLLIYLCI